MGKKGKKTRWRRLPIGAEQEGGLGLGLEPAPPTTDSHHRITFNEDEYTKITTPRQDVLFKKGYFGRKRNPNPDSNPSPAESQEVHSGDSVESESCTGEEVQYTYPAGYVDPNGVYYVNGSAYEAYDPYTGTMTVVVGPPAPYPGAPPLLAALPYQPVPLQQVEWFNPSPPPPPLPSWCHQPYNRGKRYSTDSQNCSAQSSESTGPPGSPQESVDEGACAIYTPQYVYPGYMFGPPIYNMNGVTVQGMVPQPVPVSLPADISAGKRRKKRRRRRRGGVTDDGSESSCCEEPLTGCQSEGSSDAGVSSKANSDSGINTDPTPNSGSNSPPPQLAQVTEPVHSDQFHYNPSLENEDQSSFSYVEEQKHLSLDCQEYQPLPLCSTGSTPCVVQEEERSQCSVTTPEESSEVLSAVEDDITPNLCAVAPEFSSQESTLSCLSTPSITKELLPNENEISSVDLTVEENFERIETCQTATCVSNGVRGEDLTEISKVYDLSSSITLSSNAEITPTEETKSCWDEQVTSDNENKYEVNESSKCPDTITTSNNIEQVELSNSQVDNNETLLHDTEVDEGEAAQLPENSKNIKICDLSDTSEVRNKMEDEIIPVTGHQSSELLSTKFNDENTIYKDNSQLKPSGNDSLAPVPPPRKKRSICRAAEKIACRIVDRAIKEGVQEAATCSRLRSPISITEAVTKWLNSQGSSPLTVPPSDSESDDDVDEGIEVGEDLTGPKNVQGNPFPVPSHNGTGQRVAKDCESIESSAGEWDMWDHSHTKDMCDPTRSVDKYYRLGADDGVADKVPPSVYKTAMHIRHSGPFPCGVCCIIQ